MNKKSCPDVAPELIHFYLVKNRHGHDSPELFYGLLE